MTALVAPARAGDTAEELHPSLFGWRGLAAQTEAGSADVTVILPDWDRAVPPDAGQQVDFRSGASGAAVLPELRGPSDLTLLAGLPPRTLAAALALEPLLQGRVVSPREPIGHRLSGEELAALRPLLRGHFSFEAWEGEACGFPCSRATRNTMRWPPTGTRSGATPGYGCGATSKSLRVSREARPVS
ncbi:hypothetical protein ACFQBZ_06980 [Deinococcus radiophilus]